MLKERLAEPTWPVVGMSLVVACVLVLTMFVWHHSILKAQESRLHLQQRKIAEMQQTLAMLPAQLDVAAQIEQMDIRLQEWERMIEDIQEILVELREKRPVAPTKAP